MDPKNRRYKGCLIRACEFPRGIHRGRWIVQSYRFGTGNPYEDEYCPHYPTLAVAKEEISRMRAEGW